MKRLGKPSKKDSEIVNFIFERAKEMFTDPEVIAYMKNLMNKRNLIVEDLKEYDYEAESLLKSTMKQIQEIYDSTYDHFYGDPKIREEYGDPTNPGSKSRILIDDYISNCENYGRNVIELLPLVIDSLK